MNMRDVPVDALKPVLLDDGVRPDFVEPASIALSELEIGGFATIHAVLPTDNDVDRDLVMRLIEIGFVPGERVRVIAVGHPGRQPIAVRLAAADSGRKSLNGATFAMRRHEADFIRVVPDVTREG
jgi:ferrous iron transport protein A